MLLPVSWFHAITSVTLVFIWGWWCRYYIGFSICYDVGHQGNISVHPKFYISTFLMLVNANHLHQEIILFYLLIHIRRSKANISWSTSRYYFFLSYDPPYILDIRPSPGSRDLFFESMQWCRSEEILFRYLHVDQQRQMFWAPEEKRAEMDLVHWNFAQKS